MRKNWMSLLFALAFLPTFAGAQMMGGGNHQGGTPPTSGMPGGNGSMGGAMGNHRDLVVGADGTVYTIRVTNPATDTSFTTIEIVAVRQTGVIGWTASASAGMTFLELSGNHLLVATQPHGPRTGNTPTTTSSKLVALSTTSGTEEWTLQLDGFAMDLEPFAEGTYVTVVKPVQPTATGGMHDGTNGPGGKRTLVAVGTDGKVLWSVPLTK